MLLDIAEEKDENALSKECELPAIHRIGIAIPEFCASCSTGSKVRTQTCVSPNTTA